MKSKEERNEAVIQQKKQLMQKIKDARLSQVVARKNQI